MCPRIRRTIWAAVLGLVGGAGTASAQAPQPLTVQGGTALAVAAPAPATVAPGAMAYTAPAPVAGTTGCGGGCDTCGGGGPRTQFGQKLWNSPLTIGEGCANSAGCGTLASERTFLWGGCNQFFTPGNKCGGILGGGGLFARCHGLCAQSPLGPGGAGNVGTCCYGSYLNR